MVLRACSTYRNKRKRKAKQEIQFNFMPMFDLEFFAFCTFLPHSLYFFLGSFRYFAVNVLSHPFKLLIIHHYSYKSPNHVSFIQNIVHIQHEEWDTQVVCLSPIFNC